MAEYHVGDGQTYATVQAAVSAGAGVDDEILVHATAGAETVFSGAGNEDVVFGDATLRPADGDEGLIVFRPTSGADYVFRLRSGATVQGVSLDSVDLAYLKTLLDGFYDSESWVVERCTFLGYEIDNRWAVNRLSAPQVIRRCEFDHFVEAVNLNGDSANGGGSILSSKFIGTTFNQIIGQTGSLERLRLSNVTFDAPTVVHAGYVYNSTIYNRGGGGYFDVEFEGDALICHDTTATPFQGPGTYTNTTTADPEFVDAGTSPSLDNDYHWQTSSPAIDLGVPHPEINGWDALDFEGEAFDDTAVAAGAYAAPSFELLTLSAPDAKTVLATFSDVVDPSTADTPASWRLEPADGVSGPVEVIGIVVDAAEVTLSVHPFLSAGGVYEGEADGATDLNGLAADPDTQAFSVSTSLVLEAPGRRTIIEALLRAMSEQIGRLGETSTTLLADPLGPDDSVALVESTFRMPSSGAVWIAGHRVAYASKTDAALSVLTEDVPRVETIPRGTPVVLDAFSVDVGEPGLSQMDLAHRRTLIHRADGKALDDRARDLWLPRPGIVERSSWRDALRAVVYAEQGTPGVTKAFLRAALQQWNVDVEVTLDPAQPARITATSGSPFSQEHVGRDVLIDGVLYRTVGPQTVGGTHLDLAPFATADFEAADWKGLASPTDATATILPFVVWDLTTGDGDVVVGEQCVVKVDLWIDGLSFPPTYLVESGGDAVPAAAPQGGHIAEDELFVDDDPDSGPWPIYLAGDVPWEGLQWVLNRILASGYHASTRFRGF